MSPVTALGSVHYHTAQATTHDAMDPVCVEGSESEGPMTVMGTILACDSMGIPVQARASCFGGWGV